MVELRHELVLWWAGTKKWTATLLSFYYLSGISLLGLVAYVLFPYRLDYALSEGLAAAELV